MSTIECRQLIAIVDDELTNAQLLAMILEEDYDYCVEAEA